MCPSRANMSQSSTVPGGSSGKDEHPSNGCFNFKGWVGGLHDYLTASSFRHPEDASHLVDQGVEMADLDQGPAVTSTPKRGILKNANSNGGQRLGDPTPSQQSTPRWSQATSAQGGAGPTIKVEPDHHFQWCRNEGLGGDFSSAGYVHHHGVYLVALEECALEVSQLSRELAPFLTFSVCEVPSTGDLREAIPPLLADLLHPLLSKVGRLRALVKNHVTCDSQLVGLLVVIMPPARRTIRISSIQTGKF